MLSAEGFLSNLDSQHLLTQYVRDSDESRPGGSGPPAVIAPDSGWGGKLYLAHQLLYADLGLSKQIIMHPLGTVHSSSFPNGSTSTEATYECYSSTTIA